jgi:hypothetical protein
VSRFELFDLLGRVCVRLGIDFERVGVGSAPGLGQIHVGIEGGTSFECNAMHAMVQTELPLHLEVVVERVNSLDAFPHELIKLMRIPRPCTQAWVRTEIGRYMVACERAGLIDRGAYERYMKEHKDG